ncbi:uncharacterized protein PV07_02266 [Cladophialophora immunda]|uniref:Uncharacterized protein n=1 Tax=Cladophialophora immunda TaxID=569365 RepID=A0A0D2A5F7_9EURO|nr:uncharacterized protein PV07_02266 [Cladophialophora immunda]KIW35576.1 hypothetical protein PV07_02266 [Cladophialophora immunda]
MPGLEIGGPPKVVYSKPRLQHALDVYQSAWERSTPTTNKARHLRQDYQFRRVHSTSNFTQAISWYDDDSSDEYRPTAAKRRRLLIRKIPKAKRTKHDIKPESSVTSPPVHDIPSLVTFYLKSDAGRALLCDLAKDSTGYEASLCAGGGTRGDVLNDGVGHRSSCGRQNHTLSAKTFLRKQDEESEKIGGGTNRSGLKRNRESLIRGGGPMAHKDEVYSAKPSDRPCESGQEVVVESVECTPEQTSEDALDIALAGLIHDHSAPTSPAQPTPIQVIRAAAVEIQQARNVLAGVSREHPIILDSPQSSPKLVPANVHVPVTIRTPWAHPINFKFLETSDKPCHFCEDFRYGIYGYGIISVKVFQSPGQCELQEMGNGHRSSGKEATPSDELYCMYVSQLVDIGYPKGPALKRGTYYACSLCTHPAFWRCCADKSVDKYLRKLDDVKGKGRGCGLVLCDSCAVQVERDKGILKQTTVQERNGYDCRRADMEFLFAGSLLHKAWA